MRIIAGEFRGRQLLAPQNDATRPITDRAKQSLFDILAPWIEGAIVYDCFAGTGSMGLECLSRGAAEAVFFEQDRSALALLKRNISALKVEQRSRVIAGDLFKWFATAEAAQNTGVVFLDPPYRFLRERADDLRRLSQSIIPHLNEDGIVVFRHDAADVLKLPGLASRDVRDYGTMRIELLGVTR